MIIQKYILQTAESGSPPSVIVYSVYRSLHFFLPVKRNSWHFNLSRVDKKESV